MNWNEITLAFINGPGLGLTAMVLGFFGLIGLIYGVGATNRRKDAVREAEDHRRASDLELIKSQMARMVDDQKAISTRITSRPSRSRRNAVVDAEAN